MCSINPYAQRSRRNSGGFTLIEMVIVVILLGILGVVGASMLYSPYETASIVNSTNNNANKARYAIERVARELRETKYDGSAPCITTPTAATVSTITFRNNTGSTSSACTNGNSVTISLGNDGTLYLGTTPLADSVTTFSLTFKDNSNNNTSTVSSIQSIVIQLTVAAPASGTSTSPNASTLVSQVFLRNT